MVKVFRGIVTCGDSYRSDNEGQMGAVWIGGVDVIDRLDFLSGKKVPAAKGGDDE